MIAFTCPILETATTPGTPRQASESFGRVGRRLLVAGIDQTHTQLLGGFVERVESVAAQRRDPLDATFLKAFHKPFGSRHFHVVSVQTMSEILNSLAPTGDGRSGTPVDL